MMSMSNTRRKALTNDDKDSTIISMISVAHINNDNVNNTGFLFNQGLSFCGFIYMNQNTSP